jgi:hypothetical protein
MVRRRRVARPVPGGSALGGRPVVAIGWLLAVAVLASCAGTLASTVKGPSTLALPAAFECVQRELQALGYKPGAFDRDAGRLTADKTDPKARRPHTLFLRVFDRLEVEAAGSNAGSLLVVRGQTFNEFSSQRGATLEEEAASATVRADADALLERCKQ